MGYHTGKTKFEQVPLEAAISGLVYELVEEESRVVKAARKSFLNFLRNAPANYNRQLLANVQTVTIDDLQRVLAKYIVPLFDPAKYVE